MPDTNSILLLSAEKYRFLLNNILDVIIEIDLDGTFSYISPQVKDIFGYKPKDVIGNPFFSYIHPEDMPVIMESFEKAIRGKKSVALEYRVRHKEGHYIPVFAKGSLVEINDKVKIIGVLREISERKLVEQKLKESEENFREITEQSFMGICIIQDSLIKYINKTITHILGYSAEEIKKWSMKDFLNVVHPDDRTIAIERLGRREQRLIVEQPSQVYRVFTKTGEMKWMDIYSKNIQYQGKIAILATLVDVSEGIKAEHELEKEKEKAQKYLDIAGVILLVLNADQTVQLINRKGCEILEEEESDIIGINWIDKYIPENNRDLVKREFNRFINGEIELFEYTEEPIIKKNGEKRIIAWNNRALTNEEGRIIGSLSSGQDITESKITEQKSIESETKYRALFEQAVDSIVLIDTKNGNIIDYNDRMYENLGYTREEFKNIRVPDFDLMEGDEDYRAHVKKIIREGSDVFETKYKTKTGEIKDILVSAKAITIEDKIFLYSILRDITKQKQIEKELREINTLKSELLERTSHELKTPLISIKGFTDLLLDLHKEKFDGDVLSILGEIKQGTERLETIINKLLESFILESGKIQFKPNNEDLSFLIRFCIKNLRGLAKTRNHFIKLDIPDKIILNFEKERIYEVITHLIINAIKYTPPYGEIKIQTEKVEDYAIVSVQDNGIGLLEEEQKKLFKQFGKIERYGQGWDIGTEGTGMGLYTSKKIVELHGGEIWVESEGRNKGAKFCFSLPINKN